MPDGTTKQRSAVELDEQIAKIGTEVQQALPGCGAESRDLKRRTGRVARLSADDAALFAEFGRRVANRFTAATVRQYSWVLRDSLMLATTLLGEPVSLVRFYSDLDLLGKTLASGMASDGGRSISAWLASQRRSVARAFALLMEVELKQFGLPQPVRNVDQALQQVAELVGTGYRLPVGWSRGRGGRMPMPDEAEAVRHVLSGAEGWIGFRNEALLCLLADRGLRIGALLRLDGADLHRLPNGQGRMILKAKSSIQPFEVAVPKAALDALEAYVVAFNTWARAFAHSERIGFGVPGLFWRGITAGAWTYPQWSKDLAVACSQAGVEAFTAHGYRRAFATLATTLVSRSVASLAGNWTSPRRMDDHYVQPSLTRLRTRLSSLSTAPENGGPAQLPTLLVEMK